METRFFRERLGAGADLLPEPLHPDGPDTLAADRASRKRWQAARRRGEELGLTEEELDISDALEPNDRAVQVLFDEQLRTTIARAG